MPTAQEYLEHCVQNKLVPEDAAGGLYKRVFIRDYSPVGTPISQLIRGKYGTPGLDGACYFMEPAVGPEFTTNDIIDNLFP